MTTEADLFDFYDIDGNGLIQRHELIDVLSLCAHEIGLDVDFYLEQIADAVFSNANLDPTGAITFEDLREVLRKRPNLVGELALTAKCNPTGAAAAAPLHSLASSDCQSKQRNSSDSMQSQRTIQSSSYGGSRTSSRDAAQGKDADQSEHSLGKSICLKAAQWWDRMATTLGDHIPICNKLRWEYISNNWVRFNFFLTLNLILLLLMIGRVVGYWPAGPLVVVARACGQSLNFLCSIIVLLVCRRSISLLRVNGYGRYLPLDDHVYFHKIIGIYICLHSLAHTLAHVANFLLLASAQPPPPPPQPAYTATELLFSLRPGIGWIGGAACLTGWLLLAILVVMSLAQPFARSLGKFELFYYTHLLYIPFWILLFVHAPRFWHWFLGPFLVFLVEALIRLRNLLTTNGQTTIIKAVTLPSDVIHLVIKRPANFEYKPGDWLYLLVPQIAKYEWHPFTISSAPEQDGIIWLHIRAVGEWTRCLRSYFEGLEDRNHLRRFIKSGQFSISMDQFSSATGADLSAVDSAQMLGASKKRERQSFYKNKQFDKTLTPIPENRTIETTLDSSTCSMSMDSSKQQQQRQQPTQQLAPAPAGFSSQESSSSGSSATSSRLQQLKVMPKLKVFIDGPYGSPSSQIFRAEHAVLIATGIGVTPFASILQSIVNHYEKMRQRCPSCASEFLDTRPPFACKLRKVDFVWINRDQKSFEWFIKLMAELELTQTHLPPHERFLDIHIHLTAMQPKKTKSIGLQLALYLVHEKNKKDLVTGLRTRTKAGRPDWDEFFDQIQSQKRGKVSVFFCGRPQLGRQLHRKCDRFGFKFRKEIF